jgi:purine nucleosidase
LKPPAGWNRDDGQLGHGLFIGREQPPNCRDVPENHGMPPTGSRVTDPGFPGDAARLLRLGRPPPGASIVLDTDAANEIDDQFALAYALLSPELHLEAVYAAPFVGRGARTAADGMAASKEEILRVLDALDVRHLPPVLDGAEAWLTDGLKGARSPASDDLVRRAEAGDGLLYVMAIGAPTNVAAAIEQAPDIVERIVVVWLGGNATYWHRADEYNARQDRAASRLLFESRVPLVHVPCYPVTEALRIRATEIDRFVRRRGPIGDLLADLYDTAAAAQRRSSWIVWDIGPVAWFVNAAWAPTVALHSPILTTEGTWSHDAARHLIAEVRSVDRDAIFDDFFAKLDRHRTTTHD